MRKILYLVVFMWGGIYGNKVDNPTILLSYPCSGNHLTRFIIEYISALPTTGTNFGKPCKDGTPIAQKQFKDAQLLSHVDCIKPFIVYKSHTIETIEENCNSVGKLILIIRSFKECIPSKARKIERYLHKRDTRGYFDLLDLLQYLELIEYYTIFNGPKLLIYYEDLLKNPVKVAQALYKFLDLNNDSHLLNFEKNSELIIKKSRQIKNKEGFGAHPYLNTSKNSLVFYQNTIDKNLIKKRENFIKTIWKDLPFLSYIERYFS